MKRYTLVVFCVCFSMVLSARATIKFKQTSIDFGDVQRGKPVNVNFEFENIGNEVLKILDIRPSCGCTATGLDKREYKPGEKGALPVRFDSSAYSGRIAKSIVIRTNDDALPSINLTLMGNVIDAAGPKAKLSAESFDFGSVKKGKTYTKVFSIANEGKEELKITEVQHWPDYYLVFPAKVVPAGKSIEVKLVYTPMEEKSTISLIKILSNDRRTPYMLIKVESNGSAK